MHYLRWDETSLAGMDRVVFGLVAIWTEVDDDGVVQRELGFDIAGQIVHRCPSTAYRRGTYGLLDMATVQVTGIPDELTKTDFERKWAENDEDDS